MKISALIKLKQGDLWRALKRLKWSQKDLADRTGIHQTTIGQYINLKKRPSEKSADKIQFTLAKYGEYIDILKIWPKEFKGLEKSVQEVTKEIPIEKLISLKENIKGLIPIKSSVNTVLKREAFEVLKKTLNILTFRERIIIQHRYLENPQLSLIELSKKFKVTTARIREIERKALWKLRNHFSKEQNKDIKEVILFLLNKQK